MAVKKRGDIARKAEADNMKIDYIDAFDMSSLYLFRGDCEKNGRKLVLWAMRSKERRVTMTGVVYNV